MPQLVTDPDLIRQLEASDAAPAAPPPAPAAPPSDDSAAPGVTGMPALSHPSQARLLPPGTRFLIPDGRIGTVPQPDTSPLGQAKAAIRAGAPHAAVVDRLREQGHDVLPSDLGMKEVTDPAILQQLEAPDPQPPGVRFAPQGQVGANGLVWDKDGGRDPATGELVMAGKPMTDNAPASQTLAASTGFLSGVPIAGPYLEAGTKKLAGAMQDGPADQVQAVTDQRVAGSQAAYPKTTTAAGIGGAVVGMAPAIAAAPEVFGAGGGGLTIGKMGAGALSGSAIGGVDAAVRSDGDPKMIRQGALGGAIGGAAGPAIAAIGGAAGQGIANGVNRLAEGGVGLPRPVAQTLMRAAQTDGALGPEGLARIREAGPSGMLADIGPSTAGVLDTAMQRGGPGATAARQAIEARAAGADHDLTATLDRTLGAPQGVHTATTDIRTGSAPARSAAYEAAYAAPIDYTSPQGRSIEMLMRNHVPADAIRQANALIRADPAAGPSQQILAHVGDNGSVVFERMPDVRQLDYVTRGLNDVADAANGQGKLGGTTQLGATYSNLSRAIRSQLRQAVPEYGQALDTAAEPIAARNALQFGSELLRPSTPRDVAAETIGRMTPPELEQVRQGVRSQISETLSNVRRTITDPNVDARQAMALVKDLSSDAAQEKVGMILGDGPRRMLSAELTRATRALELRSSVATNSRTAGRTMTNEAVKQATAHPMLDAVLGLHPQQTAGGLVSALFGRSPAAIARQQDAVYGDLARTLTEPRGPQAEGILERLLQANTTSTRAQSIAGNVPYGMLTQTGLLSMLPSLNSRPQ